MLLLAGITHLYYKSWRNECERGATKALIPKNAALAYVVAKPGMLWETLQTKPFGKAITQLPCFLAIQNALSSDSLGEEAYALQKVLRNTPLTISIHRLDEEHIGCVFYLNTQNRAIQALLEKHLKKMKPTKSYAIEKRSYAGYSITEVRNTHQHNSFSYIMYNHYLIGSFSAHLIEDIIRGVENKNSIHLEEVKRITANEDSLYVNFNKLVQLLRVFVKNDKITSPLANLLTNFAQASQLELNVANHHLLLNGLTFREDTSYTHYIQTLANQNAYPLELKAYIPHSTMLLTHYTLSNAEQWFVALKKYWQAHPLTMVEATEKAIKFPCSALLQLKEVGHCILEGDHADKTDQLLFMRVQDTYRFISSLEKAGLLTAQASYKLGQRMKVYPIVPDQFQPALLHRLFPNFEPRYLTLLDNYIILANSKTALETLFVQFHQGKTWAATKQQNLFLDNTLEKANLSLFVTMRKAWPQILHLLKPAWRQVFQTLTPSFQAFERIALQLRYEAPNHFYTSILLAHTEEKEKDVANTTEIDALQTFQAEAPIITKPFIVKSHVDQSFQVLLQDALYQLYLLDKRGVLVWKKSLDGPLVTNIAQIDFYHNNKLQYLLATDTFLYLLDRNGDKVAQFPHKLPHPGKLMYLHVVDYDGSKNYRFLTADQEGNIYLYDQYFKPLLGWNPKSLQGSFVDTPLHIRINSKDCFIALQRDGKLYVWNRKGKFYKGFPFDLKAMVDAPLIIKKGNTFANTTLTALTIAGELVAVNLEGIVKKKLKLHKTAPSSQFSLCPSQTSRDTYRIVRQDAAKIALLDEEGNLLFEKQYTPNKNRVLQYYDLGNHNKVYALTDSRQHFTYLYDQTGKLMLPQPLNSSHKIGLVFSKKKHQLEVYSNFKERFSKYILPY